jgi:hypothetical protein
MSTNTIDDIVGSLAAVRDDELTGAASTPRARLVLETIAATPRTPARVRPQRGRSTTEASAATVLQRAAAAARDDVALVPASGQFLYTKSIDAWTVSTFNTGADYTYLQPHVREVWLGATGGRLVESSGAPIFLTERDRTRWIAAGSPSLQTPTSSTPLSPARPLDLPTDPDALYRQLEHTASQQGTSVDDELFVLVSDALRETETTPAQRAALYEVVSRIPGVGLVGSVVDPVGRAGIAVGRESYGIRRSLIFDPKTYALLAEEDVAQAGNREGYAPGTRVGYAAYLAQAVVDAETDRP